MAVAPVHGRPLPVRLRRGRGSSHARFGEARYARLGRALAQVVEPGEREARRVEPEIDDQGELRAAGERDRLAEPARDQVAAARADRANEAERCAALDAGILQRERAAGFARALRL